MERAHVRVVHAVPRSLEKGPFGPWAEYLGEVVNLLEAEITRLGRRRVGAMSWRQVDVTTRSEDDIVYEFRMPHTPILGAHPTFARLATNHPEQDA